MMMMDWVLLPYPNPNFTFSVLQRKRQTSDRTPKPFCPPLVASAGCWCRFLLAGGEPTPLLLPLLPLLLPISSSSSGPPSRVLSLHRASSPESHSETKNFFLRQKKKMIKRRFYKVEHGDNDYASSDSSSSSSSDSEVEPEQAEESEDEAVSEPQDNSQPEASTSSVKVKWCILGYQPEDSSANEIDPNATDSSNEDDETGEDGGIFSGPVVSSYGSGVMADEDSVPDDMPDCVFKCKSVFRCRICPRIICLSEENMRIHLGSKRHARSEKLLKENRLKAVLNSDGEIENQETAAEMNTRIITLAQREAEANPKRRRKNEN
ncbi:hypothetical protein Tsubulata_003938 [Turnera subulata]|uniref:Uncharacterized protein n=1 Tax=Turnera subulata TaxID=218843 RepID=A0A9Q0GEC3_9ROSI|nr:hypothetical protein Tsubulata_003938 [Turnera subulata]